MATTVTTEGSMCPYKWKKINDTVSPQSDGSATKPKPRHGHRAVGIKELIIVFGGGNEGIINDLAVFNTNQNTWFNPVCKAAPGEAPKGCAAFGFVVDNTRLLVFGGMQEYGTYSGDLHELQATKWEWHKLKPKPPTNGPPPCPRLGHTFTLVNRKVYLFGGLCNASPDTKTQMARYLNDFYALDISKTPYQWEIPETQGTPPPPRESHTVVAWTKTEPTGEVKQFLVLYGGMSGVRLGDLWFLDLHTMTWVKPVVSGTPPPPRSLHTAVISGNKMYVFGGWTRRTNPTAEEQKLPTMQRDWKCTNSLGVLDLEFLRWDTYFFEENRIYAPRPRAGHCAAMINSRMYVWSGRDGYKKEAGEKGQVCCDDIWFLETMKPGVPGKVQLVRASTNSLDVHWGAAQYADCYHLQVQVFESTPSATTAAAKANSAAAAAGKSVLATPQGKNLPSGTQFVTLMKPGGSHGITLTAGSSSLVGGMVKLVPQGTTANVSGKPATIMLTTTQALKGTPGKPLMMIPTATVATPVKVESAEKPTEDEKKEAVNANGSQDSLTASKSAPASQESVTVKSEGAAPPQPKEPAAKQWHTVGLFTELQASVSSFCPAPTSEEAAQDPISYSEKGWTMSKQLQSLPLQPGTAYKFRVAGLNQCGRGSWSEMSAFKTCLPGFPGAPSNIKITKSTEGALLTWEPPANHGDTVTEYAVYLATKPHNAKPDQAIPTSQLSFVKVYDNPTPTCTITHENLRFAYYDTSGAKPAIIFRIAAKNEKGYGPATQVRWLQGGT